MKAVVASIAVVALLSAACRPSGTEGNPTGVTNTSPHPAAAISNATQIIVGTPSVKQTNITVTATNLPTIEVAQAVMVTVELDFGPEVHSIAEALPLIERRSQPDDGQGRTFAILDAYGEKIADGKWHISMHVSTEKTGIGALVFRRTGEVLWQSKIVPATHPPSSSFAGKQLFILVNDGKGKDYLLDGSKAKDSIMQAEVRDLAIPLADFWGEGEEREVTVIYSACGCPVKVTCRRTGGVTVRTKELPVMFPDDPAVVASVGRLMGWQ